jgi:hypothetical protein
MSIKHQKIMRLGIVHCTPSAGHIHMLNQVTATATMTMMSAPKQSFCQVFTSASKRPSSAGLAGFHATTHLASHCSQDG